MYKFFIKSEQIKDETIVIIGTDVNHIVNVLRLKAKEQIQVCDMDTSKNYIVVFLVLRALHVELYTLSLTCFGFRR